ncbi:hypothetical protein DID76_04490 [Candidatus Marinamargulisbacteria bacterium SCGC AG-414-C22]|nr:hypothetical protein DID76_04490 [Candidatus Marinamargulisbacteria bacterium SCGC AG-414-C22]
MKKILILFLSFVLSFGVQINAKNNSFPVKNLKNINSIAPIMIQFNRSLNASAKGMSLTSFKVPKLSEEESAFYLKFSEEIISSFQDEVNIEVANKSVLKSSNSYQQISKKDVKPAFVLPAPYQQVNLKKLKAKNIKKVKELCRELNVDAILAFDFDYGVYSTGVGPLSKKKYQLKSHILIIDKNGKVLIDTKIKPDYIKGNLGVSAFGVTTAGKADNYYLNLKKKWFEAFREALTVKGK